MAGMGDAQDIARLIPRLRRYACALTGDLGAGDDLVQHTLERARAKRHLFEPGLSLSASLHTLMHQVYLRQRGARAERLDEEVDASAAPVPLSERLRPSDLERALQKLPDEQREVLLLVSMEGLSYEEVAAVLGVPVASVMSLLSRAREKLRAGLTGAPGTQLRAVR